MKIFQKLILDSKSSLPNTELHPKPYSAHRKHFPTSSTLPHLSEALQTLLHAPPLLWTCRPTHEFPSTLNHSTNQKMLLNLFFFFLFLFAKYKNHTVHHTKHVSVTISDYRKKEISRVAVLSQQAYVFTEGSQFSGLRFCWVEFSQKAHIWGLKKHLHFPPKLKQKCSQSIQNTRIPALTEASTQIKTPHCVPSTVPPPPLLERSRWLCHFIDELFAIDRLWAGSRRSKLRVQFAPTRSWETHTHTHTHTGDEDSVPSYLLLDPNLYLSPLTSAWGIDYGSWLAPLSYWAAQTPDKLWTCTYTHVNVTRTLTLKTMSSAAA